jgi:hypothetical protein
MHGHGRKGTVQQEEEDTELRYAGAAGSQLERRPKRAGVPVSF